MGLPIEKSMLHSKQNPRKIMIYNCGMSPIPNLKLCVYIQNAKLPSPLSSIWHLPLYVHFQSCYIYIQCNHMCTGQIYGKDKKEKKKKKHKAFTLTTICHVTPSISKLVKTFLKRFWVFVADGVVERLKGFILGNHPSVISHL